MKELAMLRLLISQLQDLVTTCASPSSPTSFHTNQPPFIQLNQHHCHNSRWHGNVEDDCADDYITLAMAAGKSKNSKNLEPCKPPPSKKSRKEKRRGKLLGPSNGVEEVIMEERIWKRLPEDLLELVISRLAIATFFQFRSVCRKWNSLQSSKSFSYHCSQVPQPNPWFYTKTHENNNSKAIYDPSSKKWHHLTLLSLPSNIILLPVASAGGLVCFIDISHRRFYVCNPLSTQSLKELPNSSRSIKVWSPVSVGMTLSSSNKGGYKIMWVGCDGEYEVYDSLKKAWTCPGTMPSSIKFPFSLNFRSQAVSISNTIYFMRFKPEGMLSYNMVNGTWNEFSIPSPLNMSDHTLAECEGRIMLAGVITKNAATCIGIWELQKMTLLWKEVDRMPNIWCLDFYGKHVRMTCLGNKGLLMLSLRSKQMNRIVTYNVLTREWLKVSGCGVSRGKKRQWIASGTGFYPNLTAMP